MARYTIVSIDNETIGRGGRSVDRGEFESAEAALGRAKELVDGALLEHFPGAASANELMSRYMLQGSEVPMIYGEPRVAFSAYRYAREKANEMFSSAQG